MQSPPAARIARRERRRRITPHSGADSGACPFSYGRAQPGQLLGAPSEASEALAGVGAADPLEGARRPVVGPQASPKGQADRRARKGIRCMRQQAGPCRNAGSQRRSQRHHSITAISMSRTLLTHATTFDTNNLSCNRSTAATWPRACRPAIRSSLGWSRKSANQPSYQRITSHAMFSALRSLAAISWAISSDQVMQRPTPCPDSAGGRSAKS